MYRSAKQGACAAARVPLEEESGPILCRPARGKAELREAHAIRHAVFVEEQGLFDGSDRDRFDEESVTLVAEREGRIVGTVRLHEEGGGRWRGSRLAVLPGRRGRVGAALVRAAVDYVARREARLLVADIQEPCLGLFLGLGWEALGPGPSVGGTPHVKVTITPPHLA